MSDELDLSLKDFIKNTLVDINEGIIEAHKSGVALSYKEYGSNRNKTSLPTVQTVSFDIAVELTESESKGKEKGAGVKLSILNLAVDGSKNNTTDSKNVNRIQFSVDAFLGMRQPQVESDD